MGFKTDREFLRNLTVGAVGTRRVAEILRGGGCEIIELERYSQSNKIWTTKVKRLRVPDLLCLRCGTRIESRAKSNLAVIMSHAENNPDRAWDKGLRDRDLVACIKCTVDEQMNWQASSELTLFSISDLRAARPFAKSSRMKASSEGSEVFLTWPTVVPKRSGEVVSVSEEAIKVRFDSGKNYTYRLVRTSGGQVTRLHSHVGSGDRFGDGSRVIASVVAETAAARCPASKYDFLSDLRSSEREIVYGAVKALGRLAELRPSSIQSLKSTMSGHADMLVRLESAASLARLDVEDGWEFICNAAKSASDAQVRMESALILGELHGSRPTQILKEIAIGAANPSELRAAAAWGIGTAAPSVEATALLDLIADPDETVALHSIVTLARLLTDETLPSVFAEIGRDPRQSAAIIKALQIAPVNPIPEALQRLQTAGPATRNWLLYLMAALGRERCIPHLSNASSDVLKEIEFFWKYQSENWTNRLEIADQMDFLTGQVLEWHATKIRR